MKKWEYKIECFEYTSMEKNKITTEKLKELGLNSWELINIISEGGRWYSFVFKREIN